MKSGFASDDITPPVGAGIIGTLFEQRSKSVLDPLSVNVAIFEEGDQKIGIVQLDTLSIRWTQVNDIRRRIESEYGFPGRNIMVCASHNHAGPAVARAGWVQRDEPYIESMVKKSVRAFGRALASSRPCRIGNDSCLISGLAFNRRIVMKDGAVTTNITLRDPNAEKVEGPVDQTLGVICVQDQNGSLIGAIVNFALHPVHHNGESVFSAGFPGVLARALKARGVPVTLFLNGACGNISGRNPHTGEITTKEQVGERLAENTWKMIQKMTFSQVSAIDASLSKIELTYRKVDRLGLNRSQRIQKAGDLKDYNELMNILLKRIKKRKVQPADIQVLFIGDIALAGIPGEVFSETALSIKKSSLSYHTWVIGYANGMVGYLPPREAVLRGGYEATFSPWSRMSPEAGDQIANEIIRCLSSQMMMIKYA